MGYTRLEAVTIVFEVCHCRRTSWKYPLCKRTWSAILPESYRRKRWYSKIWNSRVPSLSVFTALQGLAMRIHFCLSVKRVHC